MANRSFNPGDLGGTAGGLSDPSLGDLILLPGTAAGLSLGGLGDVYRDCGKSGRIKSPMSSGRRIDEARLPPLS